MNCEKFQILFSELVRESMMDAGDRSAALQHAAECQSCATNLQEQRGLTASLGNLAVEMQAICAPPQLETKLLAAFRERSKSVPVVVPMVSNHRPRYWAAAIAAALLIAFAIFIVRGRLLDRPEPQQAGLPQQQTEEREAKDQPAPKKISIPEQPRDVPRKQLVLRNKPRQAIAKLQKPSRNSLTSTSSNQENPEVATDFFPISYGNVPNLQEGGQLLRVELPRAAVARFGLPVNFDRGTRVKADVLVGADGLAQAIRFVQ